MMGADQGEVGQESDTPVPLPVELAFLMRHGVAAAQLVAAAERARRLGVEPACEAIASGTVGEATFYRALASELGLPFEESPLPLLPGGEHGAVLRAGIAPVIAMPGSALRFALAPSGPALRSLLEAGPRGRDDIAVTTPRHFAASLREANAASLARRLAGVDAAGLARRTARTGSSRGQKLAAGLCIGPGAYAGTLAPFETFSLLALLAGPVFLAVAGLRLAAALEPPATDLWQRFRWRIDEARLPVYTVAVPLLREEAVLPQLIGALSALDYPAAKLEILLLVEAGDTGMRDALAVLTLPPCFSVLVVPPGGPRTKPRALNLALAEARGAFFAVYDAEDHPDPRQLRQAAARFLRARPDIACMQARLTIDNAGDGLLPALFALEYAGLFEVLNPGLLRFHLPILLGGTSNHFRTDALRAVGGWDAWNVTEDADIGIRLVRAGHRIADLPSLTWEEAPVTLPAWLRQRSRWIKGHVQTLICHLRDPAMLLRQAGPVASATFLALALGGVVTALGYPVFAVAAIIAWSNGALAMPGGPGGGWAASIALMVMLAGAIAILLPPALGAWRRGEYRLLAFLPLLPLYYGLVSAAAWLALLEYVTRRHSWNKTAHGLARSSTRVGLTDAAAIRPPLRQADARY
jgi:hypothetical protein